MHDPTPAPLVHEQRVTELLTGCAPMPFEVIAEALAADVDTVVLRESMRHLQRQRLLACHVGSDLAIAAGGPFYDCWPSPCAERYDPWDGLEGRRWEHHPTSSPFDQRHDRQRRRLVERDGNRCGVCSASFPLWYRPDIEHRLPRSLGGRSELTNLQLAHKLCNQVKGVRPYWTSGVEPLVWFDRVDGVWREVMVL